MSEFKYPTITESLKALYGDEVKPLRLQRPKPRAHTFEDELTDVIARNMHCLTDLCHGAGNAATSFGMSEIYGIIRLYSRPDFQEGYPGHSVEDAIADYEENGL